MKFEHTQAMNFENAFRGLRNPLESWEKSDSKFGIDNDYSTLDYDIAHLYCIENGITIEDEDHYNIYVEKYANWLRQNGIIKWYDFQNMFEYAYIGPKDLSLAHRMIKAGESDSKFLRQIFVSVDITAPLYWWKEADTYKVATVANSTSTMHKLASTPITKEYFELSDFGEELAVDAVDQSNLTDYGKTVEYVPHWHMDMFVDSLIDTLEDLRQMYLKTKDKKYWKELIRWLPEGWLQTRTWTANYAVLRNIYFQRKNHKLTEWHSFCRWVESLPYAADLITYTGKEKTI